MRDSVRAAPGPTLTLTLTLHKRQGARPLTLTLARLGTQPPPQSPFPRPDLCLGVEAGEWRPRAVPPRPHSPAPAWRPRPGRAPPPQRLSQRQAWMRRPRLGPAAPAALAATSGDGRAAAAPGGVGRGARLGAAAAAAAGACRAWRALRRRRGDRSARGARPRPQRHPPVWGPARGPRGGASLSAAPRANAGLAPALGVALLLPPRAAWGSGSPRRAPSRLPFPRPRLAEPGS